MSIDSDLKRIADALEKIALTGMYPQITVSSNPGNATAGFTPENQPVDPEIKTAAELKALAQTIAAGIPEGGIGKFTDYVRNEICARCGVKKLIEIPVDRIPEAAKLLLDYGKKE